MKGGSRVLAWGIPIVVSLGALVWCTVGLGAEPAVTRAQLEADWLRQLELRYPRTAGPSGNVTVAEDAAGAVDGVKDGKWGFHTENEALPWWQVDLGSAAALDRIVLYNRCDGGFEQRAAKILILLSSDGKQFQQVYQHDGTAFLGQTDNRPLSVPMQGAQGRFVRLQLPGTSYFHLDEVEIYAVGRARISPCTKRPPKAAPASGPAGIRRALRRRRRSWRKSCSRLSSWRTNWPREAWKWGRKLPNCGPSRRG